MEVIKCPYCGDEAECVRGSEIYHGRPDLRDDWFWMCDPCDARVGCHDGTQKPYGTLANNELRARRMRAHVFFDPLWKKKMDLEGVSKGEARRAAYRWLADRKAEIMIPPFDPDQFK